jgi:hypothetical protein
MHHETWTGEYVLKGRNCSKENREMEERRKIDEQNTRLIMRVRTSSSLPTTMHVMNYILEPGYFIMYRGMLLGVKERAERTGRSRHSSQRKDKQHV